MRAVATRRFFTIWVGWGIPPFFFGSAIIAFNSGGLAWGLVHAAVCAAWAIESAATTCRRCAHYGTGHCGLPGRITPLVFRRRSASSVSLRRIRLHRAFDFAMIAYMNVLYATQCPSLAPFVAVGSIVTLGFVYRAKRFHGLLHRLREPQRVHLPVLVDA